MPESPVVPSSKLTPLAKLRPHPRNYRSHPADQLEHLAASISEHGFYRNVVVARDGTILAGHGAVQAAELAGLAKVPVVWLDVGPDDPQALKVLTGDNELMRFADIDDRELTALLKEVNDTDLTGLLGTGYDEAGLAALVMVTRDASEIRSHNDAAEWVGMPSFEAFEKPPQLILNFDSEEERERFTKEHGVKVQNARTTQAWVTWWPYRERDDIKSLAFQ